MTTHDVYCSESQCIFSFSNFCVFFLFLIVLIVIAVLVTVAVVAIFSVVVVVLPLLFLLPLFHCKEMELCFVIPAMLHLHCCVYI